MQTRIAKGIEILPAGGSWSRERSVRPRWRLRVLPIRIRPSLFGGD